MTVLYRRTRQVAASHTRRSNGEGSIYETTDGAGYRGSLIVQHPTTGQNVRRYVRGRTRADVTRKLRKLREGTDAAYPAIVSTGDYLTAWLERSRQGVRPSTWKQRELHVKLYLGPAVGAVALARLTPADVERMTSALVADGKAPRTAALARIVLRRALADAVRDGAVPRNVAALARPPRIERHELQYLDAPQLRRLLEATGDHALGPLIAVAATTGLRQGELLGLRWQDVDTAGASLTVRRSLALAWDGTFQLAEPKTKGSRRTINLPARAVAALDGQRARQDALRVAAGTAWQDRDGLVFTNGAGMPLRGPDVTHGYQKQLLAIGLPRIPFHALRHSMATALLTAGVPLKVVSETLGHSTITLTADTYAHVAPELRKDAADAMDRALR